MAKARTKADGLARIAASIAGRCDVCGWQEGCACWGCVAYKSNMPYFRCCRCYAIASHAHNPSDKDSV